MQRNIYNKKVIAAPNTPYTRRYTILWNINFQKIARTNSTAAGDQAHTH